MTVMIDIEALGLEPTACILSIGAAHTDGSTFYTNVDLDSCLARGMTVTGSTVLWWMRQSDEARAIFSEKGVPVETALFQLGAFISRGGGEDEIVYANGVTYDISILASAYNACKIDIPWKYWNVRDFRTLKHQYPEIAAPTFKGVKHNALSDALYQLEHLKLIMEKTCSH